MSSSNSYFYKLSQKNFFFKKIFIYYNVYIRNFKFLFNSSQLKEDEYIISYFKKGYKGNFVDLGCFHPTRHNNTFQLYKKGWRGINIDLNKTTIGLFDEIRNLSKKGHYILGVCLGMQLLFEDSEESKNGIKGLSLLEGGSKKLKTNEVNDSIKVPFIDQSLAKGMKYFVKSGNTWSWKTPGQNAFSIGNKLLNSSEEEVEIVSLTQVSGSMDFYSLDVEDIDTYFQSDVVVHNLPPK